MGCGSSSAGQVPEISQEETDRRLRETKTELVKIEKQIDELNKRIEKLDPSEEERKKILEKELEKLISKRNKTENSIKGLEKAAKFQRELTKNFTEIKIEADGIQKKIKEDARLN